MSTTYNTPTVQEIKSAVVSIIATFRGFYTLTESEVKLEELTTSNNQYVIRGKYDFHPLFGNRTEEGTFEITLGDKLKPVSSKVIPKGQGR